MKNSEIIQCFEKLIQLRETQRTSSIDSKEKRQLLFSISSLKRALIVLQKWKHTIKDASDLNGIKDFGDKSVKRVREILETGTLEELEGVDFTESIAANELKEISGFGDSNAYKFVRGLGISSREELFDRINEKRINSTLTHSQKIGIKYFEDLKYKIPRREIKQIEKKIKKEVRKLSKKFKIKVCGSYRRLAEESGDIDILITHPTRKNSLVEIINTLKESGIIIDDITNENYKTKYMGICRLKDGKKARHIDIRFIKPKCWPSALLYFTGSGKFNVQMRLYAKNKGYKISEYGVYSIESEKRIKGLKRESDIFELLGVDYVNPKNRISFAAK